MCLFCFLNNYNQHHIREGIQLRTDRFEHTLEKYKISFLDGLKKNLSLELCEKHTNENNSILLKEIKNISFFEINTFFEELRKIYISWIDSNPLNSLHSLKNLLKNYEIDNIETYVNGKIFFRGRESSSFISHWDMFHIPFNRRFLIGNQRYSLIGQPLLYLASSPYCVLKELDKTKDIKISSFRLSYLNYESFGKNISFDHSKYPCYASIDSNDLNWQKNNLRIYNNTDNLSSLIKTNNPDNNTIDKVNNFFDNENITNTKRFFFQQILANCCSFRLKNSIRGQTFCEEYVLPQILAQVIKEDFDGIMFNSTHCYEYKELVNNSTFFNLLCRNVCIFTKYDFSHVDDVTYVYDKNLYNKFLISSPIDYTHKNVHIDYYDIKKSINLIANLLLEISKFKDCRTLNSYFENLLLEMSNYLFVYNDLLTGELKNCLSKKEYDLLSSSIILHTLSLRNIILNIRDFISNKEDYYVN